MANVGEGSKGQSPPFRGGSANPEITKRGVVLFLRSAKKSHRLFLLRSKLKQVIKGGENSYFLSSQSRHFALLIQFKIHNYFLLLINKISNSQ